MTDARLRDTHIHIEPSSRCTLECPQCPRTLHRGSYGIDDCDIDSMTRACHGYENVIMCGNHGDPIYHPRFHDLLRSLRQDNPSVRFHITTNGAFRSKEWWEVTATLLQQGDSIMFSIDGLPTNNHMYRVNSKWETIETSIRILREIKPNLYMKWKWIAFRYNQHDAIEGAKLARSLGFNTFTIVHSARYGDQPELQPTRNHEDIIEEIREWVASYRDA